MDQCDVLLLTGLECFFFCLSFSSLQMEYFRAWDRMVDLEEAAGLGARPALQQQQPTKAAGSNKEQQDRKVE